MVVEDGFSTMLRSDTWSALRKAIESRIDIEVPFPLIQNLVPFLLTSVRRREANQWVAVNQVALANGNHLLL